MKLPILYVSSLPNLFKHCSTVTLLHIDLQEDKEKQESAIIKSYIHDIKELMYQAIEANFITCQASRVTSHNETFIVCKTNVDSIIMTGFVSALMAELDQYLHQEVTCSWHLMNAMIVQEGVPIKMLQAHRAGVDVKQSVQYQKQCVVYDHKKKPRGKQLITLEEYMPLYNKQSAKTMHTAKDSSSVHNRDVDDSQDCEYFI